MRVQLGKETVLRLQSSESTMLLNENAANERVVKIAQDPGIPSVFRQFSDFNDLVLMRKKVSRYTF